jgi:hypothetical protein
VTRARLVLSDDPWSSRSMVVILPDGSRAASLITTLFPPTGGGAWSFRCSTGFWRLFAVPNRHPPIPFDRTYLPYVRFVCQGLRRRSTIGITSSNTLRQRLLFFRIFTLFLLERVVRGSRCLPQLTPSPDALLFRLRPIARASRRPSPRGRGSKNHQNLNSI